MFTFKPYINQLDSELHFAYSRSSGPGGQHVNKVNTKVELRFSVRDSQVLLEEEKLILIDKLKGQLNQEGELIIIVQETRSQLKNKQKAIQKFYGLINMLLKPRKKRKSTSVPKAVKEKRLKTKLEHSQKKERRRQNYHE